MYSTTKSIGNKNPITLLELFRAINYASKYFIINNKRVYQFLIHKAKSIDKSARFQRFQRMLSRLF
jgi:hypothetical protein